MALRRDGARPGDLLFVSGTPGVAAAGLELLQAKRAEFASNDARVARFLYAEPRLALGRGLRGIATAAMDISDGLLGDVGKLCVSSRVAARVELESLPTEGLARSYPRDVCERLVLHGGDDYELLFTVDPARVEAVTALAASVGCPLHRIGTIHAGAGVECVRAGSVVDVGAGGYDHFAQ
jgi:thiamine-monophosphate kinase